MHAKGIYGRVSIDTLDQPRVSINPLLRIHVPSEHMICVTKMLIKYNLSLTIKIILTTLKYSHLACIGPNFQALPQDS